MIEEILDISSKNSGPAGELSNFTAHTFYVLGFRCESMEGFLQGLKIEDKEEQLETFLLVGSKAKNKGKNINWKETQILFFQGEKIPRDSEKYQELLDTAFEGLSHNESFKKSLLETQNKILTHSIGKSDIKETILTEEEFCNRLMNIREKLK